ncbi:ABC transporter ATP-binding protein [uncultured Merdimonas sp.]|uniref:ABC transporter ATP-binding protein n=1 Tax=uncultured Merdimonas sp. TaxID=2023269 RepID=UPI003209E93D
MDMKEPIVEVNDVSMMFRLYRENVDSLKEFLIKKIKRQIAYDEFWALKNVSFQVGRGEAVGLVGKNGSGKSTLLKTIAGVLKPTTGNVLVRGTVAPMIELGAGFDMDLTAKENIFLNGALLGYPKEMLEENMGRIIEFSELDQFMDVPIKNFSSGMIARLGFAVATIYTPDILIVDEILSVGDWQFQAKCHRRIQEMLEQGTTLLFVSHSMDQVKEVCSRAILLSHGQMLMDDAVEKVCERYGEA